MSDAMFIVHRYFRCQYMYICIVYMRKSVIKVSIAISRENRYFSENSELRICYNYTTIYILAVHRSIAAYHYSFELPQTKYHMHQTK